MVMVMVMVGLFKFKTNLGNISMYLMFSTIVNQSILFYSYGGHNFDGGFRCSGVVLLGSRLRVIGARVWPLDAQGLRKVVSCRFQPTESVKSKKTKNKTHRQKHKQTNKRTIAPPEAKIT